jgi:hypothetical protein
VTAAINLRGQVFGRLTVLDDSGEREGSNIIWRCVCSCGTEDFRTSGKRLRSGKTSSCGCLRREKARARRTIDVSGVEFGFARFLRDSGERRGGNHPANGAIVWECECFGGRRHGFPGCKVSFKAVRGDIYEKGQVSCGCYRNHIGRSRAIDVSGEKFGFLTAVQPTEQRSGHDVMWLCICESPYHPAPREHVTSIAALRSGHTRSCGCLFTDQMSQRAIAKMKSPHRKDWPYVRGDGTVVWMRAATEIAWAACLDAASIEWQYEPKAHLLSTGLRYVPDFYLPEKKCWHEVKGRETQQAMAKYAEFAQGHDCRLIPISEIERVSGVAYKTLLERAKQMRDDYNDSISLATAT